MSIGAERYIPAGSKMNGDRIESTPFRYYFSNRLKLEGDTAPSRRQGTTCCS